jgi:predicted ATPase
MRAEMSSARASAESFLRQAETDGLKTEDAVAHLALGLTCLYLGELALAQSHLEEVLADHLAQRDTDAHRMFGNTITVISAAAFLAIAAWVSGGVARARHLIDQAVRRAHESHHVATIAQTHLCRTILEACRGDAGATLRAAEALLKVGKEHNMTLHTVFGEIFASWARGCIFDAEGGVSELLQRLGLYLARGNKATVPLCHGMLAELEAMTGRFDDALASVEAGLALAKETGERWTDPLLFRCKGGILLQRDPANPTPAEEAFRAAIAVAQQQGSLSFGLRAAISLAKLYQSTSRMAEAQAVLATALEGFSPTPEMPEIAKAQTLLAVLA